jgi:DNA-directed RNA polymerase subunit RPC12/RpoP
MKIKHFDKEKLIDCPICSEHTLHELDKKTVECNSCNFRGTIKRSHKSDKDELHITIDGDVYRVEPVEEKVCVVVNNELVCVTKEGHDY